jgi:hypothetical protein
MHHQKNASNTGRLAIVGTAISKRRAQEQAARRVEIQRASRNIAALENQVLELDAQIEGLGASAAVGDRPVFLRGLDIAIEKRNARRGRLEVFKRERDRLESALQSNAATEEETRARQEHQREFVRLAGERLQCDRAADALIEELRELLTKRAELSGNMQSAAHLLDLELATDGLDTARFENCLASLTVETLSESSRWYDWFFGILTETDAYVVLDESLEVSETFASHGLHAKGDLIRLRESEARELLRIDRPVPGKRWEILPPSIVTLESYRAAEAEVQQNGGNVETILLAEYEKRQRELTAKAGPGIMGLIAPSLPKR